MQNNHFLYRHTRVDTDQVFYIGIGTKKPFFTDNKTEYRRAFEKTNRTIHWTNIINKTDYNVEILFESSNYDFIKEKEKEFIKIYGRKDLNQGTLVNFTNGGEGDLGRIVSKETKKKMSITRTGKKHKGVEIYQYSLDTSYIKTWESLKQAEDAYNLSSGCINNCFKGFSLKSGGYYWSKIKTEKYNIPVKKVNIIKKINILKPKQPRKYKKILQLDKDNNFINEWESLRDIHTTLYINKNFKNFKKYILNVISGKRKSAFSFNWKYIKSDISSEGIDGQSPNSKPTN